MNKYTICGKKTAKKAEEMGMDTMIIAMFAVLCILMAADLILVLRKKDRSDMPTGIERRLDSLETEAIFTKENTKEYNTYDN